MTNKPTRWDFSGAPVEWLHELAEALLVEVQGSTSPDGRLSSGSSGTSPHPSPAEPTYEGLTDEEWHDMPMSGMDH